MPLIHHDTTGTATDSVRPLSRKKLKQLMPQNHDDLTSASLMNSKNPFYIADRKKGPKRISAQDQKIRQRVKKATKKERQRARANGVQLPSDITTSRNL